MKDDSTEHSVGEATEAQALRRLVEEAQDATHAPYTYDERAMTWGPGGQPTHALTDAALAHFAAAIRKAALADARALVLDDAWAMTFQTLGQYRTALARALSDQAPSAP